MDDMVQWQSKRISIAEAAKQLGISKKRMAEIVREHFWVLGDLDYKTPILKQQWVHRYHEAAEH